jgi:peroxiredoxin
MIVMSEPSFSHPVQPGEPAPVFELPAITRDGKISLGDFRGSQPVLLGLFRGLSCPFCRRQIAALGALEDELHAKGIEALAVVSTPAEQARAYVRYRPMRLLVASDEKKAVHRAYGLPQFEIAEGPMEWPRRISMGDVMAMRINPAGELPEPMNPIAGGDYLNAKDKFELPARSEPTEGQTATPRIQLVGTFLVDREGIVRWTFIEGAGGPSDFGRHPESEEVLAAASSLAR